MKGRIWAECTIPGQSSADRREDPRIDQAIRNGELKRLLAKEGPCVALVDAACLQTRML